MSNTASVSVNDMNKEKTQRKPFQLKKNISLSAPPAIAIEIEEGEFSNSSDVPPDTSEEIEISTENDQQKKDNVIRSPDKDEYEEQDYCKCDSINDEAEDDDGSDLKTSIFQTTTSRNLKKESEQEELITELKARLKECHSEIKKLKKQNSILEENASSLWETAKKENSRKDFMIAQHRKSLEELARKIRPQQNHSSYSQQITKDDLNELAERIEDAASELATSQWTKNEIIKVIGEHKVQNLSKLRENERAEPKSSRKIRLDETTTIYVFKEQCNFTRVEPVTFPRNLDQASEVLTLNYFVPSQETVLPQKINASNNTTNEKYDSSQASSMSITTASRMNDAYASLEKNVLPGTSTSSFATKNKRSEKCDPSQTSSLPKRDTSLFNIRKAGERSVSPHTNRTAERHGNHQRKYESKHSNFNDDRSYKRRSSPTYHDSSNPDKRYKSRSSSKERSPRRTSSGRRHEYEYHQ